MQNNSRKECKGQLDLSDCVGVKQEKKNMIMSMQGGDILVSINIRLRFPPIFLSGFVVLTVPGQQRQRCGKVGHCHSGAALNQPLWQKHL
jgi:hypothetical protein